MPVRFVRSCYFPGGRRRFNRGCRRPPFPYKTLTRLSKIARQFGVLTTRPLNHKLCALFLISSSVGISLDQHGKSVFPDRVACLILIVLCSMAIGLFPIRAQHSLVAGVSAAPIPDVTTLSRTQAISEVYSAMAAPQEKESRTPEQRKIDSQLLYAIYQMRGEAKAKGVPTDGIRLRKDDKGRVLVDVRAIVTDKLVSTIRRHGGRIVSRSERYHSILAYVALGKLETIARSDDVKFISPAAEARTN